MGLLCKFFKLLQRTLFKFFEDNGTYTAASIAFYALLSIFPILFGLLAVIGYFPDSIDIGNRIADILKDTILIPSDLIVRNLENITRFRNTLSVFSIIGLIWALLGVFGALNRAINKAWDIEHDRNYLLRKIRDLGMAVCTGLLMVISIEANSVFPLLRQFDILKQSTILTVWGKIISVVLVILVFAVVYKWVPNKQIPWRYTFPGVVFGVLCFESVRNIFTY